MSTETILTGMGRAAKVAARVVALAEPAAKVRALTAMAARLRAAQRELLSANEIDLAAAKAAGRPGAFIDRLALNPARVEAMAKGIEDVAALTDPVGETMASWTRPNGLVISRVRVPLGVIGMIFESRPNVTADAGALALKSGNAVILRAGSESLASSSAIAAALRAGLAEAGLPRDAIQLVPTADRAAVGMMLAGLDGAIDVIIPRGGKGLVERVQKEARVPVFAHLEGICHVYADKAANLDMAQSHHRQRQAAAHGRVRRGRVPADRQGGGGSSAQTPRGRADRCRL